MQLSIVVLCFAKKNHKGRNQKGKKISYDKQQIQNIVISYHENPDVGYRLDCFSLFYRINDQSC